MEQMFFFLRFEIEIESRDVPNTVRRTQPHTLISSIIRASDVTLYILFAINNWRGIIGVGLKKFDKE